MKAPKIEDCRKALVDLVDAAPTGSDLSLLLLIGSTGLSDGHASYIAKYRAARRQAFAIIAALPPQPHTSPEEK